MIHLQLILGKNPMKKMFLPLTRLAAITVAGISFASLLAAQPSFAQLSTPDSTPSGDLNQNNANPFPSGNSSDFNMFDLIHRANFGTLNWNSDQQNQQLDEAALEFRKRQQQAIQNGGNLGAAPQSLPIIRLPENTPAQPTVPAKN
ncbi:hypothetical protein NIES2100_24560 [Calothrix sp. NIES-2100]|uniref:hypothetical protein n=1 Tax=Calothrix sp. NIES-2100 TaxID=1954172 RepID=UPI000B6047BF|nr:hypothetical protein NIES2100_24560 [Calothrix sp. NIES-2100]